MTILKHKLTIDDLIASYLIEKLEQGYEPKIEEQEFINFLIHFIKLEELDGLILNFDKIVKSYIENKNNGSWQDEPHVKYENGILVPNSKFGLCNEGTNLHFMSNGEQNKIRKIITQYLENLPKRDISTVDISDSMITETIDRYSSIIVFEIWKSYIEYYTGINKWPKQCDNIYSYLLTDDLAKRIKIESIKKDLLEFYSEIRKRLYVIFKEYPLSIVASSSTSYLYKANYKLVTKDLEYVLKWIKCRNITINNIDKTLTVDSPIYTKYFVIDDECEKKGESHMLYTNFDKLSKKLNLEIKNR